MAKSDNEPFSTRLPGDVRARLQTLARSKGLTVGECGRMLLIEKLNEYESSDLVSHDFTRRSHAVTIAALSEKIDYVEALEILSQYLDAPPAVTP